MSELYVNAPERFINQCCDVGKIKITIIPHKYFKNQGNEPVLKL